MNNLIQKLKQIMSDLNSKGLSVPLVRDPHTGTGSVSLTLVFISFNFCLIAMVGKWSGYFGAVDSGQAMNLFVACQVLYWGRKFQPSEESSEKEK